MTEADDVETTPGRAGEGSSPDGPPSGMSPYATGGGGVTFERKVAVTYLARLVTGYGAAELGDGRRVLSVAFQQAPEYPVDDLVVMAASADEVEPSLVLALGVRRAPNLVQSDELARKLVRAFVEATMVPGADGVERRLGLVVAGPQPHAQQAETLAAVAASQMAATAFFELVRTPNRFPASTQTRLEHIEALVKLALGDLGVVEPDTALVQQRTWELLARLSVLMPRLETPDETDWAAVINSLVPVARGGDLGGATRLRDRLVALADSYPPRAATVDLNLLRRDAHTALAPNVRHHQKGWQALDHLHERALSSVDDRITSADGARHVHIDRSGTAASILAEARVGAAVVVHGESGVGKSALVLGSLPYDSEFQAVAINLRHLPASTLEFESLLGSPLTELLAELSAPRRLLIVDGADSVAEGRLGQFRYVVDAAHLARVGVVAITSNENEEVVRSAVSARFGEVADCLLPGLSDAEIDEVTATFGELTRLAEVPRSRELLRRPVVIDLLVRGGITGVPVSEADGMSQVWFGLVRRHEQADRGTPDARELAMLRIADLALSGGDRLMVMGGIDATALAGLRRDGLLRSPTDDPFAIGPEFAHDEVRRYAIARLLLADADPTTKLVAAGVPRWTLGAARLACQVRLSAPDRPADPLCGRFSRLQAAFDALVDAGHGARWIDVPGEALLTIGDPRPVLQDAWEDLRVEGDSGLRRLGRLVDQRLRDSRGLVRALEIGPLVALLLDDDAPWSAGEHVQQILREWLRSHVVAETPAGHPLRERLRERLVETCAAADRRLEEERAVAAAARATRSPEEIEAERRAAERFAHLLDEVGFPRGRDRERPEVPHEFTDEVVVELLALLGPDLGESGEAVLQRIGRDEPSFLAPAVEELLTGRALAGYRRGFLAEITEAYYIDHDADGLDHFDDGIRDHHSRSVGLTPFPARHRGPFMPLFQTDFRRGVAVLNRMLDHGAMTRARGLASRGFADAPPVDHSALDRYRVELGVTGTARTYIGDPQVWFWYRGTGVGPYPCTSALLALEHVCDQLIGLGFPIGDIVAALLEDCGNLAMVGFVVGLLVRHLERADRLLDPFLQEPEVWRYEFARITHESSGLGADSTGLVGAERRQWSMRETAMYLVLRADETRVEELRIVGDELVHNARRATAAATDDMDEHGSHGIAARAKEAVTIVRSWASALDRNAYTVQPRDGGIYIQSEPPTDVVEAMQAQNVDIARAQEEIRLSVRYLIRPSDGEAADVQVEDLEADLRSARELLRDPPAFSINEGWDTPTAVAVTALAYHLRHGVTVSDEMMAFAVDTVLRVSAGEAPTSRHEYDGTFFEHGADRSAARALPALLLPDAAALLAMVDGGDGSPAYDRVLSGAFNLSRAIPHEVRLHLARGLDQIWAASCSAAGSCHHEAGLQIVLESVRDCVLGPWDPELGRRTILELEDPIRASLAEVAGEAIYVARLDPAMRALAPAAVAGICISNLAREILAVVVSAHCRGLLSHERDVDQRGTHALTSARALLTLAAADDDRAILDHVEALAVAPNVLGTFLRAASAAAEESTKLATAAQQIWPAIVTRVLDLAESGNTPSGDRYFGYRPYAALIPNAADKIHYLYRELDGDPIAWWTPAEMRELVERWLPTAARKPESVDQLISFLRPLGAHDQVCYGLPWVAQLVLADPDRVAGRSFLLSSWLIDVRDAAVDARLMSKWQQVVDALVVAGVSNLAPYSE